MFELNGYKSNDFIDKQQLKQLTSAYEQSLKKHPIQTLSATNTFELIHNLKRTTFCVGPYSELSLFEIANRLYSDLVILDGAKNIFENSVRYGLPKIKSMKLLLSNINGFDIELHSGEGIIYGEAFNVAPSYFQPKVRDSITKFNTDNSVKKAILVFNEDALDDRNRTFLKNQIEKHEKLIGYVDCKLNQWRNN